MIAPFGRECLINDRIALWPHSHDKRHRLASSFRGMPSRAGLRCLWIKEFQRFTTQPDGTVVQQITGTDRTRFTTDSGASITVNISGPAKNILYPNGDVETVSMGRYGNGLSEEQAAQLGTPQIFTSSGLIDYLTHADGSITPVRVPNTVTDICAALGAS
jgi:hypothetical protein